MNHLFEFSDYRSFLADYHARKKRQNPAWSYGLWAQKLGLKDNSALIKIVGGKREAGPLLSQKFIEYFKLGTKEAAYFQELVKISKFKHDPEIFPVLKRRLQQMNPKLGNTLLDEKEFQLLSHWLYFALRQMTQLKEVDLDPQVVSQSLRFKVSPGQIKKALDLLKEKNLLSFDQEKECWVPGPGNIRTNFDFASEAIKLFHERNLDNAKLALRQVNLSEREFLALIFAFPHKRMEEAKQLLRDFIQDFSHRFEGEELDCIYQLQMNFYPLTKNKKERKKT